MTALLALKLYAIATVLFVVLDLIWLGLVANGLYRRLLGDLLRDSPNVLAAVAFYALFLVGLTYFAIAPAVDGGGGVVPPPSESLRYCPELQPEVPLYFTL